MTTLNIMDIDTDKLIDCDENPNVMDPVMLNLLSDAIKREGFLQPVLVSPIDGMPGRFVIVDGHHRVMAARANALAQVPCVVGSFTERQQAALRIGMNRMRGDLDLSKVADIIRELSESGCDLQYLQTTGFTADELNDLLRAADKMTDGSELFNQPVDIPEEEKDDGAATFVLEVEFASRSAFVAAKKALKRAAGKGGSLADGLAKVLALDV